MTATPGVATFMEARGILDCSAEKLWSYIEEGRLEPLDKTMPPKFEESKVQNLRLAILAPKVHPKPHGTARPK